MTLSRTRILGYTIALLASIGATYLLAKPEAVPGPIKARLSPDSGLASFEFLGCTGNWTIEDPSPQVWLAGSAHKTTFLVRHPAGCGYSAAERPRAWSKGGEIHFDYELVSDGGDLAACLCEYWATFSLKSNPDKIVRVTLDGKDARMMGALVD